MKRDVGNIEIKQFTKERDEALLSMDKDRILAHMRKWGVPVPREGIFWLAVHKARTGATSLPMFERAASKRWLIVHGMHSLDDGDVLPPVEGPEQQKYLKRCRQFGCV